MSTFPNQAHGFLSLNHAAKWCDVSLKTFTRWIAKGLPIYQAGPGEKILIAPEDIRAFLTRSQADRPALDVMVDSVMSELKATTKG